MQQTDATDKKLLFIFSKSPYGSAYSSEGLDALLAAAAFEQNIDVLFRSESVFNLVKNQQPETIGRKNFSKGFAALPIYGVTTLCVDRSALEISGLSEESLMLPIKVVEDAEIRQMIRQSDHVFSF